MLTRTLLGFVAGVATGFIAFDLLAQKREQGQKDHCGEANEFNRALKDLTDTVDQMRRDLYKGRNDTPKKPKNEAHSLKGN